MMNKALVIAAHPDDELLGCGGTISKLQRLGWEVSTLILGAGRGSALDNKFDSVPLHDWVEKIEEDVEAFCPFRVYTHSPRDANQDHRIVNAATVVACRPVPSAVVREVLFYEAPSATEYGVSTFSPSAFEVLDSRDVDWKIAELLRLYPTEMRAYPHPRSKIAIQALAIARGVSVGHEYAEAFEVCREIR